MTQSSQNNHGNGNGFDEIQSILVAGGTGSGKSVLVWQLLSPQPIMNSQVDGETA